MVGEEGEVIGGDVVLSAFESFGKTYFRCPF